MNEFIFPFTAIVGQDNMKLSLILNAIDPRIGGVLVKGERGTAKSTAARALADLLPLQTVVDGCPFGCDPDDPMHYCDECRERRKNGPLPRKTRSTPFVNLPVSATEDRLVGTLDFEKALTDGKKHFEPGLFAEANRGILYVDEVNLLDDHIVDTLLDAAAMGINHIEREGISFSHPARFIMIGTMNPEEGELRPQLLDRFAHSIEIRGVQTPEERVDIIRHAIAFEADPEDFRADFAAAQKELAERISQAQHMLPLISYAQSALFAIANLTAEFKLEGHRADIVILKTARARAAFEGRTTVTAEDITKAAELTIPHRIVSDRGVKGDLTAEVIGEQAAKLLADMPEQVYSQEYHEEDQDKKKQMSRNSII